MDITPTAIDGIKKAVTEISSSKISTLNAANKRLLQQSIEDLAEFTSKDMPKMVKQQAGLISGLKKLAQSVKPLIK